ncbi:hypothetical protein [Nesterenkonia sp.]|uniref:hypothetical protein n=1 Tax=Nesterenkonia sp. TaxID=704201 RepID=UPI00262AD005|nr:hypothetical protein [Nesterenkonia sp.]
MRVFTGWNPVGASAAATLLTVGMLAHMLPGLGGAGPMIYPMLGLTLVSAAVLLLAIRGRGLLLAAEDGAAPAARLRTRRPAASLRPA